MKIGIILTTYNRPTYLKQCLESLQKADIPEGTYFSVVDDCSSNPDVIRIVDDFEDMFNLRFYSSPINKGISFSLKLGYNNAFEKGCDVVMNLDADAIVKPDFIQKILALKNYFPQNIVTGFHCTTRNKNGSERHPIISTSDNYCLKSSVGGINMCMDEKLFRKYMEPALDKVISSKAYNWDALTCINSMKDNKPIVCTIPSVIQHIGFDSSMNHNEPPDVADDFDKHGDTLTNEKEVKEITPSMASFTPSDKLSLPNVTLVIANCDHIEKGKQAINESIKDIDFGVVKFFSSEAIGEKYHVPIEKLKSKHDYSHFMVKELGKHIETDFVLVIQHDGYVRNYKAWDPEFLKYDYIGATWWYTDGMNVGNGGFSLRSKRLQDILSTDPMIRLYHPEDHQVCRTYRKYLENKYGIKFAPDEVAKKFSIEGHNQRNKSYSSQFGFHGNHVNLPKNDKPMSDNTPVHIIVLNQPFGLGDHIFCMPIARDFIAQGYKVIIPVVPHYVSSNKHFPEVTFIDKNYLNLDLDRRDEYHIAGMKVIPIRFSYDICKVAFTDCMKSKYILFGQDWKRWRETSWVRDKKAEDKLFYQVLGLKDGESYTLVNNTFRQDNTGRTKVILRPSVKQIEMKTIEGFTLFDWVKVIENASAIHTVSTSLFYLLELMDLKTDDLHLYCRKPDERDFRNINYLFTKKYQLHF